MQAICNQTSFESDFSRIFVCVAVEHDTNGPTYRLPVSLLCQFNLYSAKYICCADAHIMPSGRSQVSNTILSRSGFCSGRKAKLLTMQACDVDMLTQSRYLEQDKLRRWVVIGDDIPGEAGRPMMADCKAKSFSPH
jgi:hypothetical protein